MSGLVTMLSFPKYFLSLSCQLIHSKITLLTKHCFHYYSHLTTPYSSATIWSCLAILWSSSSKKTEGRCYPKVSYEKNKNSFEFMSMDCLLLCYLLKYIKLIIIVIISSLDLPTYIANVELPSLFSFSSLNKGGNINWIDQTYLHIFL